MANLETLPQDIYNLFDPDTDHTVSEDNLDILCNDLRQILTDRLKQQKPDGRAIRFSSLGKPNRQIYYDANPIEGGTEAMPPKTYFKFLYGDVIEQLLLFLAREAGHEVTNQQAKVEVDGITGSIDAVIDGVVVDVKSASPYGYQKFATGTVAQDDPFGYVYQLAGYTNVLTPGKEAAWLAADKVGGDICVSVLAAPVVKYHPPGPRIAELKEIVQQDEPPERCYSDVPDGKSGNMKLPIGCSYCKHKFRCWENLRGFAYSTGPRYLTVVKKEPNVPEIL